MILTIFYLLICWLSGDISVDYNILLATVVLDVAWMAFGFTLNVLKKKKD